MVIELDTKIYGGFIAQNSFIFYLDNSHMLWKELEQVLNKCFWVGTIWEKMYFYGPEPEDFPNIISSVPVLWTYWEKDFKISKIVNTSTLKISFFSHALSWTISLMETPTSCKVLKKEYFLKAIHPKDFYPLYKIQSVGRM